MLRLTTAAVGSIPGAPETPSTPIPPLNLASESSARPSDGTSETTATTSSVTILMVKASWVLVRRASFHGSCQTSGSRDASRRLVDRPQGPLQHQELVRAVAFSPDGKTALTGSQDQTARLWDTATGKPLGPPLWHGQLVGAVAFSPDGKTVLTG